MVHTCTQLFEAMNNANRFHTDPSGTFVHYRAKAIGSGSEGAQSELQDHYNDVSIFLLDLHHQDLTLQEAAILAVRVLKTVMEEKLTASNVQIAAVTSEKGFRKYTDEEAQVVVDALLASLAPEDLQGIKLSKIFLKQNLYGRSPVQHKLRLS